MSKKVIQVPVDEELLRDLDSLSKKRHESRSQVIRQACICYLRDIEREELDKRYQEGYLKIPEESGTGEVQVAISGEFMTEEPW